MEHKSNPKKTKEEKQISQLLSLLLLFLALMFLSSCSDSLPQPQEMGNMALLRSFAVDVGEDAPWRVTVSTGKQATGLTGNQDPPTILQGESLTLQGACDSINGFSEHYVFYGYIDQLILGEDLAREGMTKTLEYFTTNPQLSLGTGIWLATGTASDILTHTEEEGATQHLYTMTQESELGIGGMTRKAGEVLAEIKSHQASYLPILTPEEDGTLRTTGYGIIREDNLVSVLDGALAQGLELLFCHPQLIELEYQGEAYALQLSQMKKTLSGDWSGILGEDLERVVISLEMDGTWLEYPQKPEEEVLEAMEKKLEALSQETLWKLQDLKCDTLQLGGSLALRYPQHSRYLQDQWQSLFPVVPLTTSVEIHLEQSLSQSGGEYDYK